MLSSHPEDPIPRQTSPGSPRSSPPTPPDRVEQTVGACPAANLTPDKDTGMTMSSGISSRLKTGSHLGTARPILPPMPWNWYGQLSDDDLKALYAYLKTIPALKNQVPAPIPPADAPKK
jgi:hypothetical protein